MTNRGYGLGATTTGKVTIVEGDFPRDNITVERRESPWCMCTFPGGPVMMCWMCSGKIVFDLIFEDGELIATRPELPEGASIADFGDPIVAQLPRQY